MNKLFVLLPIFFCFTAYSQTTVVDTLTHDTLERKYRLFIPSSYDGSEAFPLVFNLHGATSDAWQQSLYSEMNGLAEIEGFLVCYPDGIDNYWNVGWQFGSTADDVGFINKLIDRLSSEYSVDDQRIYSCGMSNGGFMSYRLACELNDRIAAVASVTGSMVSSYLPTCNPQKPVPVMEIHGTADSTVFYTGTPGVSIHIDTLMEYWVNNNNCSNDGDTTAYPDINMNDGCTAFRVDYDGCDNGTMVSLIVIKDGAHTWPGATLTFDVTNKDIEANEEIWNFFKQYELSGFVGVETVEESDKFGIYPNPSSGFLNVSGTFEADEFEIFSVSGKSLIREPFTNNVINVSSLDPGAYLIVLRNQGFSSSKLFIRN